MGPPGDVSGQAEACGSRGDGLVRGRGRSGSGACSVRARAGTQHAPPGKTDDDADNPHVALLTAGWRCGSPGARLRGIAHFPPRLLCAPGTGTESEVSTGPTPLRTATLGYTTFACGTGSSTERPAAQPCAAVADGAVFTRGRKRKAAGAKQAPAHAAQGRAGVSGGVLQAQTVHGGVGGGSRQASSARNRGQSLTNPLARPARPAPGARLHCTPSARTARTPRPARQPASALV
jgi:hypothetical protein